MLQTVLLCPQEGSGGLTKVRTARLRRRSHGGRDASSVDGSIGGCGSGGSNASRRSRQSAESCGSAGSNTSRTLRRSAASKRGRHRSSDELLREFNGSRTRSYDELIGELIDNNRKQQRTKQKSGLDLRRSGTSCSSSRNSRRSNNSGSVHRSLRRSVSLKSFHSGACYSSSSASSVSKGVNGQMDRRQKKPSDDNATRPQDEWAKSQSAASRCRSPKRSLSSKSHHSDNLTENLHQNELMESPRQSVSSLTTKDIPILASAQQKMFGLSSSPKENEKHIIFGQEQFDSLSNGKVNPSKAIKRDKIRWRASDPVSPILSIRTTITTLTSFSCEPRLTSVGEEKMDPAVQTGGAEDEFASAALKEDGDTLQSAIDVMIELKRQTDKLQPNSVAGVPSAQHDTPMQQTNVINFSPSHLRKVPSIQHAHFDVLELSANDIKNIRPAGPLQGRAVSDANYTKGHGLTVPKKPLYRRISCDKATVPSNRPLSSDFYRYVWVTFSSIPNRTK